MSQRWKKLIAALATALAAQGASAAFQDPLDVPASPTIRATVSALNGVAVAGSRIVAVGRRGLILTSDDSGKNWTQAGSPVAVDLTAVYFATPEKGWVTGHGGVLLASTDGGRTWVRNLDGRKLTALIGEYYAAKVKAGDADAQRIDADVQRLVADGPTSPLLDVWFESEQVGYVIGAWGMILRTEDGGKSWIPLMERADNPRAMHLYAVRGAQGEIYIAGEVGLVMKLDKATQRFVALPLGYDGSFFSLSVQPGNVVVGGLLGNAFRSQDDGKTWQKVETGVRAGINSIVSLADGRTAMATINGSILVSNAAGDAYAQVPPAGRPMPIAALAPVGTSGLAVAGLLGIQVVEAPK